MDQITLGDTVYCVGVKAFPTNIKEGMFAGLRLPGLAIFTGKVVSIHDDGSIGIDIPGGHKSPWTKDKGEYFKSYADAEVHLKERLERMKL